MGFEKYVPRKVAAKSTPQVTIRKTGLISFDAAAVQEFKLADVGFFVLFFDKGKKALGVQRSSSGEATGSIPTSRRRRTVSVKAPQFFEHWGFLLDDVQKYPVTLDKESDLLIVDLSSIKRRRGRRARA
jgi:hypothetical protein